MSCAALQTGKAFLATTLTHLDCQGQTIGAYGYGALADPASSVTVALTALLTLFVALFGLRLMLGAPTARGDVLGAVVRVGIVLTLATAWPAWRVVGYNLVLDGPGEVASTIGLAAGLPEGETLVSRLQNADDGLVAMTMYGSGRLTGGVVGGSDLGDSFHGVALPDQTGFGWGRVAFLVSVIGPWAVTRIGAGLLLALAPLMAGLLLFSGTLGLFVGWLRGLAFVALASLGTSIASGVAVALIDPWAADVLATRSANTFTPSAPTELIVLGLAFLVLTFGLIGLSARIAFYPHTLLRPFARSGTERAGLLWHGADPAHNPISAASLSRAQVIADAVAITMRREDGPGVAPATLRLAAASGERDITPASALPSEATSPDPLGSSFRRNRRRASTAGTRRDTRA